MNLGEFRQEIPVFISVFAIYTNFLYIRNAFSCVSLSGGLFS